MVLIRIIRAILSLAVALLVIIVIVDNANSKVPVKAAMCCASLSMQTSDSKNIKMGHLKAIDFVKFDEL